MSFLRLSYKVSGPSLYLPFDWRAASSIIPYPCNSSHASASRICKDAADKGTNSIGLRFMVGFRYIGIRAICQGFVETLQRASQSAAGDLGRPLAQGEVCGALWPFSYSQLLISPANFRGLFSNPGKTAFKSG